MPPEVLCPDKVSSMFVLCTSEDSEFDEPVGEDSDTTRADETIGYIILESSSGTIDGNGYVHLLPYRA